MGIPPVHGSSITYADTSSSTRNALVASCSTDVHEPSAPDLTSLPPSPLAVDLKNQFSGQFFDLHRDDFAKWLGSDTTVTSLVLSNIRLTDPSGVAIAEALCRNSTLTSSDLSFNRFQEPTFIGMGEVLKVNSTLASLTLTGQFGRAGGEAIGAALETNTTLTSLNFTSFDLIPCTNPDGAAAIARGLSVNSTLTQLNLQLNAVEKKASIAIAAALESNSALTVLNLNQNPVGPDGACALAKALRSNSTLTSLGLKTTQLGDLGGAVMAWALTANSALTSLDLERNDFGGGVGIEMGKALRFNSTLRSLNLGSSVNPGRPARAQINGLGQNGGVVAIAQALCDNHTLTSLNLSRGFLGPVSGAALAEALKVNLALTSLDLSDNVLGTEGVSAIMGALRVNTVLTSLNLQQNQLDAGVGGSIEEALRFNSTLRELDLSRNDLNTTPDGIIAVAEGLRVNSTLQSLFLKKINLKGEATATLVESLRINSGLTLLNLECNSFNFENPLDFESGIAFGQMLRDNTTLRSLDLQECKLGERGGVLLAESLRHNSSLTFLGLKMNGLGQAATAFVEALSINHTLTSLDLFNNFNFPRQERRVIRESLARNALQSEKKVPLRALAARVLVQICFHGLPDAHKDEVYKRVWAAHEFPQGDVDFGRNNVFTSWSKFMTSVKGAEINLAERTIVQFRLAPNEAESITQLFA